MKIFMQAEQKLNEIRAIFMLRVIFEQGKKMSYNKAEELRKQAQKELKGKAGITPEVIVSRMLEINERPKLKIVP